MIIDMGYWTRVTKKIVLLVLSLVLVYLAIKLAVFYIPFLIGFIISLILEPIIKFVVKKSKLTRKTVATIVVLIMFAIILGVISLGIITLITESSNFLQSMNMYIEKIYSWVQNLISNIDLEKLRIPTQVLEIITKSTDELIGFITTFVKNILTDIIKGITKLPMIGIYTVITVLSTYFICTDKMFMLDQMEHHLPRLWVKKMGKQLKKITTSIGNYLKAESILVCVSFGIILAGLYIFRLMNFNIQYPLLTALTIAFVDALPILGAGTVMVPWAIISATSGNINLAIGLIVLYVVVIIVRQVIEPRIVGKQIGIHPIFTLIAMYTGFKFIGAFGLFVGPIVLIVLKNIFATMIDDGIVKNILNRY